MSESDHGGAPIRLRCDLAYDGARFSGWAKQPGLRTVQGELEAAFAMLLRVSPSDVSLTVGGRTDAGVHARGQVCHLDVTADQLTRLLGRERDISSLSARRVNGALARQQATDIVVHSISIVGRDFDARFSAIGRRYSYSVRPLGVRADPIERGSVVDLRYDVDVQVLAEASSSLLGLRDFGAFCKAREGATSVRTLIDFSWVDRGDGVLVARIEADAFCHSMVRSLVGGVLEVAAGRVTPSEFADVRDSAVRSNRVIVMPPHGLVLEEIEYPEAHEFAARAELTRAKRGAVL